MSGVQSVARAFSLLEAIGAEPGTLTELARRVDLPVSTTSRLLSTLESLDAIERLDDVGLYRIGSLILQMATTVDTGTSLAAVAKPELRALAASVREACGLSVAAGYTMHYIEQIDSDQPVQVQDWVGTRLPLHLVSSGLVTLAHWSSEAIDSFLQRDLHKTTTRSVTDPERILNRLQEVRDAGVSWTIEELELGISSAAAPVFNNLGEVVCVIHIQGPSFRFPVGDHHEIETKLKAAAARLTELVSHQATTSEP